MTSEGASTRPSSPAELPTGRCYLNKRGACVGIVRLNWDGKLLLDAQNHQYLKDGRSLGSIYDNARDYDIAAVCGCMKGTK